MRAARIPVVIRSSDVPEVIRPDESPEVYSRRLAFDKADAVRKTAAPNDFILGADTIVVVDHHVLEKPSDNEDAKRMLRLMSGRGHQVISSVCLLGPGVHDIQTAVTDVYVVAMSESEMDEYIASREPFGKAGAYGIQGMFSRWIDHIEGEYPNVVGLPIGLVYRMLHTHQAIPTE